MGLCVVCNTKNNNEWHPLTNNLSITHSQGHIQNCFVDIHRKSNLTECATQSLIRYAILSVWRKSWACTTRHNRVKLPRTKPQASVEVWSLSMDGQVMWCHWCTITLLAPTLDTSHCLYNWPHVPAPGLDLLLLLWLGRGCRDARDGPAQRRVCRQHARHRAARHLGVV